MAKRRRLKILGLIGNPVHHSLSPLMHNAALAKLKLPYLYMPFALTEEEVGPFLRSLIQRNIRGLNVTIPHKQNVIPHLDSLTREARLIGAVNTIVVKGRKLIGHNTDAKGYMLSLKEEANFDVSGKQVILLGAGGAARAIGVGLGLEEAREVHVINRTEKKAHDLAQDLQKKFPHTVFNATGLENIESYHWENADLIINSTAMGMKGAKLFPLPWNLLSKQALASDIVYTPLHTPFLEKAKKAGLKTHPGWGMLLYQGGLSFEEWTGKKAPIATMKQTLLDALRKK